MLIGPLFMFNCLSSASYRVYKNNAVTKMKRKKTRECKHVTDLRGMCLIHDNVCAHKCKLVQDFLETETMVQLHSPSIQT